MDTPIALILFNRPELTARVFEAIRQARPPRLLVIGDGPRPDRAGEVEQVAQARQVIEGVDWPCEVQTLFSPENLGCRRRVSSGLDWAFAQSETLIVLEDDCLPDPSFFPFCEQLLQRFVSDERVMMISGDNFQPARRTEHSYYFSRWSHIWGWASWRRAWSHFDLELSSWPEVKRTERLQPFWTSADEARYWTDIFDRQHAGLIDTWDYPWQYACWLHQGLTVLPETNLISNLGFGPEATHTTDPMSRLAALPVAPIGTLSHPATIHAHHEADQHTWETIFRPVPNSDATPSPARKTRWYRRWLSSLTSGNT